MPSPKSTAAHTSTSLRIVNPVGDLASQATPALPLDPIATDAASPSIHTSTDLGVVEVVGGVDGRVNGHTPETKAVQVVTQQGAL